MPSQQVGGVPLVLGWMVVTVETLGCWVVCCDWMLCGLVPLVDLNMRDHAEENEGYAAKQDNRRWTTDV